MTEQTRINRIRIRREGERDRDAVEIGELYNNARKSGVESAEYNLQAGQRLIEKKNSLRHGLWLPWLERNAEVLGFETPRTAERLMKAAAKCDASVEFDHTKATTFNRAIWHQPKQDAEEDAGEGRSHRGRRPTPDLADECGDAVKKIVERTIDRMQRGVSPRRKIELLFEVLTEVLADLHSATLSAEDDGQRPRITRRAEIAEGQGAAS
jgi:hypothetical protein